VAIDLTMQDNKSTMVLHKKTKEIVSFVADTPIAERPKRIIDRNKPVDVLSLGRKKAKIKIDLSFYGSLDLKQKRAFCFLLAIKQKYANGRVFDYSPSSLSKKLHLSVYNVKTYVSCLKEFGWAYIAENGDLVTKKMINICGANKLHTKITIHEKLPLNEIIDLLDFSLLREALHKQDYAIRHKRNELSESGLMPEHKLTKKEWYAYKRAISANKLLTSGALMDYNVIGMRRLSKVLKCSLGRAWQLIVKWSLKKKIRSWQCVGLFAKNVNGHFDGAEYKKLVGKNAGYLYSYEGNVYLHLGTGIAISPFCL
jgi:hypothetical protein